MLPIKRDFIQHPITRPAIRAGKAQHYSLRAVRAVIVHWTANTARGADAAAHRRYFNAGSPDVKGRPRAASAHYLVDDRAIVQCLPESEVGFHVGDRPEGRYRPAGRDLMKGYTSLTPNFFCIGVELCVNQDGDWSHTYRHGIDLCALLLLKHDLPIAALLRHHDVTGKDCPRMLLDPSAWALFRTTVQYAMAALQVAGVRRATVTAKGLNVRAGAGVSFPVLYELKAGEPVLAFETAASGWTRIGEGEWVNGKFLT